MEFIRGAYIKSGLITIMKDLKLKYSTPAEDSIEGWEKYPFPIGNGYAGASVFGGVKKRETADNDERFRKYVR